ncbi:MAG: HNH endonuclease [Flavobacteriales bacterium]|nr:HNH endonuclease [Flavobacteriales bacterium]
MPAALPDYLRLNRASGKAPHKPILLLAVLRAFDEGFITENRIRPSAELVNLFRGYWDALVEQGTFQPRFFLPFYHLKNERSKLWTLHTLPGFQHATTRSNSIKSLGALIAFDAWAEIRPDVYTRWLQAEHRAADRLLIMAQYFPGSTLPKTLPDQIREIEGQIEHDTPEAYVARQLQRTQESEEEEQVLRSAAFRRKIPELYGYRCAVTGLQVMHQHKANLIDACHIVPWADSYDDTITNGIALCPNMHRAFDRGLISIAADHTLLVSDHLKENDSTYGIRPFRGRPLYLPKDRKHWPDPDNLAKHRERFEFGAA